MPASKEQSSLSYLLVNYLDCLAIRQLFLLKSLAVHPLSDCSLSVRSLINKCMSAQCKLLSNSKLGMTTTTLKPACVVHTYPPHPAYPIGCKAKVDGRGGGPPTRGGPQAQAHPNNKRNERRAPSPAIAEPMRF
ncbi:hypothetical protein AVEN_266486-1 [Araneus ventricosus]|uniref:Uncharacterized protein n=1 Tax=Araneus ventricosus TaxID=182803 RepID=A0A4Y2E0F8_ARAVE|nr:hypothetical protein AVEN_266486-1 [Araneus ventricosus]